MIPSRCCCSNKCTTNLLFTGGTPKPGLPTQANCSYSGYSPSYTQTDYLGYSHTYSLSASWSSVCSHRSIGTTGAASVCGCSVTVPTACFCVAFDDSIRLYTGSPNATWTDTINDGYSTYTQYYDSWFSIAVSLCQSIDDNLRIRVRVYDSIHEYSTFNSWIRLGYGCISVPLSGGRIPSGFYAGSYSVPITMECSPLDNSTNGERPYSSEHGTGTVTVGFS